MQLPECRDRSPCGGRGQASVIGLVLVFGLVLSGSVVIVAFGATAISDSEDRLSVQRAEKALTQFDSKVALVALGNTDVQSVDFGITQAGKYSLNEGSGWMMVTIENNTAGTTTTTLNKTLGSVRYDLDGRTLAYQGGGVWRERSNESVMVSPPEFHFRNGTLTLPVVNVSSGGDISRDADIRHRNTVRKYPNASLNNFNPLINHRVKITVKSDYYKGWGRYFETRTDGKVEYDHDRQIANLTLVSPLTNTKITAATSSLSASGEFQILGSAKSNYASQKYTDSYNSSGTPNGYPTQLSNGNTDDEGDIVYGKDIDFSGGSGNSDIYGNVVSGGSVSVGSGGGQPEVIGDINYTDSCDPSVSECESKSSGSVNRITGVDEATQINSIVTDTVEDVESSNDNADESEISGNTLSYPATLDSGEYFVERIDMGSSETLTLDTSGGPVTVAVDENVVLGNDAQIEVTGNGIAKIYVRGTNTGSADMLEMDSDSEITNPGYDATQMRIYGQDNFTAQIGAGNDNLAEFVGVLYAPPGSSGSGSVTIEGGEVFGGILTGTTYLDKGSIHYDEALKNQRVISRGQKVVKVTYLHVSINEIIIS